MASEGYSFGETSVRLSPDHERVLAERAFQGDLESRDILIRSKLKMVARIASQYRGRGVEFGDLCQAGVQGLAHAVDVNDPSRGNSIATMAELWIRQSVRRELFSTCNTIPIGPGASRMVSLARRAAADLEQQVGRPPSFEEVVARLNLTKGKAATLERALKSKAWNNKDDGQHDPLNDVPDPSASAPNYEDRDRHRAIRRGMVRLGDRERLVLAMRYGLDGREPMSLKELGLQLGLSRERVRQIQMTALEKLRKYAVA